jgi:hypothetical protein
MKVIALKNGQHGGVFRKEGAVFEVKDGEKASWFVPVQAPALAGDKPEKAAKTKDKAPA